MSRSPSPKKHSLRGNEGGRRSMSLSPIRTESGAKLRTANWTKVFRAPAYRDNQHHQRGGWNNRGFNQRYNQRFNYRGGRGNFRGNNWNYNNRYQPQRRYYNRSRSRSRSYSRSRSRDRSRSRSYSPVRKRYSYSRSRSRTRDRSREKSRERSQTPPNKLRTPVNQSKSPVAQPRWDDKPSELPPQPTPSDVIGWNSSDIEVKKEEVTSQEDAGTAAMKMEKIALASIARHEKSLKKIKSKMADDEPEKKKKKKKMKKKSKKIKKSDTDSSDESSESSGSGSSSSPSPAKRKAKKKSKKQRDLRTGDSPKDKGVDDVTMKDKQKAEQPTFPFNFPQMSFPQGGSMQPMMIMPNYEEGKAMMMIAVPGVDGKMTMIPLQQGTQAFQPQPVPPPSNQVSSNVIQIQTDQSEQPEKKELTEKQKRRKEIIRTRLWPRPASSKWEDEDKSEESWPLKVKNSGELPNFDFEEATESFAQNKPGSGRGHIPGFSPDRNQEIGQKIPTLGGSQTFSETSMQEKNENKVSMASEKIESNPIVTRQNLMTTYPTQHIVQHGFDPNYGFGEQQQQQLQQQNQQQNQQPPESKWSVAASDFINERRSVASSTEGEVPSSSSDDQSKKKKSQDLRRKKKRSSLKSPEIDEKSKKKKKKRKDSIGDGDSPVSKEKKRKKKKKNKDKDDEASDAESKRSKKVEKCKDDGNTGDGLIRHVPDDLPLHHLRGLIPRIPTLASIFHRIKSSKEEEFVSLIHSGGQERDKKSLKKIQVTPQGTRDVSHMTKITLNERIRLAGQEKEEKAEQKVSVNLDSFPNIEMKFAKPPHEGSRSRSKSSDSSKSLPRAYGRQGSRKDSQSDRSSSRSPDRYRDNRTRGHHGNQRNNQRFQWRGRGQYRGNYNNYNNRGNYYNNNRFNRGYNNNYRGRGNYGNNNYNRDRQQWKPRRTNEDERSRSRSRSSSDGNSPKRGTYVKEIQDQRVVRAQAPQTTDARQHITKVKGHRKSPDQWDHDMFQDDEK